MTKHSKNTEQSNSTKPVLCNGLKATDLRIGNLVLLKSKNEKDEIAKLLSIDEINGCFYNRATNKKYINQKYNGKNSWCKFEIINPILLTEEWLFKLGFEKLFENGTGYKYDKFNISFYGDVYGFNYYYSEYQIKYVHQLQNLYFALTQRELTVA
jgi:hypothetical protein